MRWAGIELALVGIFLASWLLSLLSALGLLDLAGAVGLSLYGVYTLAAALGWVFGNVFVARSHRTEGLLRRRLRVFYLAAPPGVVVLVWSMAPAATQAAAPFAPIYAFGVYATLFAVPVLLRRTRR